MIFCVDSCWFDSHSLSVIVIAHQVLLLGSKTETIIGRPSVEGASVIAAVEEQFLDGKVLVFKKRRRKNSRRLNGTLLKRNLIEASRSFTRSPAVPLARRGILSLSSSRSPQATGNL